ncbi:MAG: PSD1 and planctomycete cytochrome C domain-containing protein, partial [Chthoniobacteraceae bacterium]
PICQSLLFFLCVSAPLREIHAAEKIDVSKLPPPATRKVDFVKDIQPLFEKTCIECHGTKKQKSGYRLDVKSLAMKGGDSGNAGIVAGKSAESPLVHFIAGLDEDMMMPPKGDALTKEQIGLVRAWIDQGAEWPEHASAKVRDPRDWWSFKPVVLPAVPQVKGATTPIDAFIRAKLAEKNLAPSPEEDRRELIRRLSIVLLGLPPTPEQVGAFVADKDPKAYEKLVDELLKSPHFGERWAQHWLDVIRWGETNGSESNLYRKNAWLYRDYVIRSFNDDTPYDRFIKEQIAGDQMGVGEATGFLVSGPHVPAATVGREPTAIRQARADRLDEIMQTVGASMLGMTVGCARCHDHKFDPISIKDYYSLNAVFQGVEFGGRFPELADDHPRKLRAAELYPKLNAERAILRKDVGFWEENWGGYTDMAFPNTTTKTLRVEFDKPQVFIDELEVFGPADFKKNLALASEGTTLVDDPVMADEGAKVEKANDGQYGTMIWKSKAAPGSKMKPWVEIHFPQAYEVNRFRFISNREYFFETDYLSEGGKGGFPGYRILAQQNDGSWKELGSTQAARAALQKNGELKTASQRIQQIITALTEEGPRTSFIGRFIKPVTTRVFLRGSPETTGDEVKPASIAILNGNLGLDSSAPDPERRKDFAAWVANPANPLTARVMVNRVWQHIFGAGIVTTGADFGVAGAPPSHPELLDYLAAEFMKPTGSAKPWGIKDLIRGLVMTDAFRQSSAPREDGLKADAGDALLWRSAPRRVEAEVIRDSILEATGKLDPKIGGRSYRIHNVKKVYAQWEVVDNHGPETWRRMIYQERMRRVDDHIFSAFDAPDCGQVRAKRPVSTTPLQALNLMNSTFVVEQSEFLALRAAKDTSANDLGAQVRRCFELLLCREPDATELAECVAAAKSVGLPIVCRTLINSNEFAFLP